MTGSDIILSIIFGLLIVVGFVFILYAFYRVIKEGDEAHEKFMINSYKACGWMDEEGKLTEEGRKHL